jgi:hypothetical protein
MREAKGLKDLKIRKFEVTKNLRIERHKNLKIERHKSLKV